ncbi:MAG: glycosyltransferase [Desertimonas sp.]
MTASGAPRVGVNLLWCLPGQVGGSEEYLARQLVGLAAVAPDLCPTLFVPPGYGAAHPELAGLDQVTGPSGLDRRAWRVLAESTWLASRTAGFDLVHHGGGTMPSRSSRPAVVTIHDLQWLRYPEYVSPLKRRYLRTTVPASARRATIVTVPSDYVRRSVIGACAVAPERVLVVPHGVDAAVATTPADVVRQRYGLGDRPFVVLPAITHPHKGHRFLLDLLADGRGEWGDAELALVLTGGAGRAEHAVASAIARFGLADRVVRTGRVPAADRDGLIAAAEALVFPSRYEGFGAPVLEAMLLGTPVVAGDQTALPEVIGDAGIIRPLDADGWVGALDEARVRRDELIEAGRRRAATFSTAASGRALADAYRRAIEAGDPGRRRRPSAAPRPATSAAGAAPAPLRLVVIGPHFAPDTAPTGRVLTRIVDELTGRGHHVDVVTALPWYRTHAIESGWDRSWWQHQTTAWGSIRRVHPFPGSDRTNLARRGAGFVGFSALALTAGLAAGGLGRRVDAVLAMSPPLTMGLTGRLVAWSHRAPLVFNIQDVFPDAAVRTGAITDRRVIAVASWLERVSYRLADAVTVLSEDLRANVVAKLPPERAATVHTIPNFVDTDVVAPADRATAYRVELGLGEGPVVLYAGNIGFSQSLELVVEAARRRPAVTFLINGDGSARAGLERSARGLENLRFAGFVDDERLPELLATGDIHVVPLRRGLGAVSVPSKTYSILAAGRPVVAAIDPGTEVPRILEACGAGLAVAPDDVDALVAALDELLDDPRRAAEMGGRGRAWVLAAASPAAVGDAYETLFRELARRP